jgi:hypothetical protein
VKHGRWTANDIIGPQIKTATTHASIINKTTLLD